MFHRLQWRIALYLGLLFLTALFVAGGYLVSQVPDQQYDQSVARMALIGVVAIAVTALVTLATTIVISRLVTRPVTELTAMVRRLSTAPADRPSTKTKRDEITELTSAFNEMAARVRTQIATLSDDRNLMAAVLSSMTDGVVVADEHGIVRLVNQAGGRLISADPERLAGRALIEALRDHELVNLYEEALQEDRPKTALVRFGLRRRQIQAVAVPLSGETLRTGGLLILHDITELRQAETIRQEFVANVSHELRTPLATLKALVETLEEGALDDHETARDFLNKMHVEVDDLTQLVRELLELSRIESGQEIMRFEPHDPRQLLVEAAGRLQAQAERAGLTIEVLAPADLPPALVAAEKIQQALINLIHNAIKFTNPNGRIILNASLANSTITFSVTDTGVGIPVEDVNRIFERFYKADKSRSSGGTGLGLAIAKHIVQAHGGRIWVESQVGRGSTFYFTAPAAGHSTANP